MAIIPVFFGYIRGGNLSLNNRQKFQEYLTTLEGQEIRIVVKRKRFKARSLNQNAWYWGAILPEIAKHTGHTPEDLHEIYKKMFLPKRFTVYHDQEIELLPTTTTLTTAEFGEYIERIRGDAAEMGIVIPDPWGYEYVNN